MVWRADSTEARDQWHFKHIKQKKKFIWTTCANVKNTKKLAKKPPMNIKEKVLSVWHSSTFLGGIKYWLFLQRSYRQCLQAKHHEKKTPWVGKLFLKSRRRGVWLHKNSNLNRNAYDLKGFMWSHRSTTVFISPNQFALKQARLVFFSRWTFSSFCF